MKTPYPWYSCSRSGGGWFVKLDGEQHPLGKHPIGVADPVRKNGRWNPPDEILSEFYRLMSLRDTASKNDYKFETICAIYLDEVADEKPSVAERWEPVLGDFCDFRYRGKRAVGKMLVNAELDAPHLEAWVRTFDSPNTRRTYVNGIKAVLKWAVARKSINIQHNPFQAVKTPGGESRAVVISKKEHEALLAMWNDSLRDYLTALWFNQP